MTQNKDLTRGLFVELKAFVLERLGQKASSNRKLGVRRLKPNDLGGLYFGLDFFSSTLESMLELEKSNLSLGTPNGLVFDFGESNLCWADGGYKETKMAAKIGSETVPSINKYLAEDLQ